MAAAVAACLVVASSSVAFAQKSGGILKMYHRDNPPTLSIHESSTNSTVIPMMGVFNNLVVYDQKEGAEQPADDRARARQVVGMERRRQGPHLQARAGREVA